MQTLDNCENINDLLNYSIDCLIKQGKKSTAGGICRYRAPDGSKCAIGHLISNENYSHEFECRGFPSKAVLTAVQQSIKFDLTADNIHVLRQTQQHHDNCPRNITAEQWKTRWEQWRAKNVHA